MVISCMLISPSRSITPVLKNLHIFQIPCRKLWPVVGEYLFWYTVSGKEQFHVDDYEWCMDAQSFAM